MNDKLFTLTDVPVSQIAEKLAEPFEPQAYKGVPGGADLTDINTGYMIERATQVFGLRGLGWKLEYIPENMVFIGLGDGKRITAHLKYAVFSYALVNEEDLISWYPIITGAANTNDFAYAEEGARTAAIGAALKSLCFQLPVYKGLLDHHNASLMLGDGAELGGNGNGRNGKDASSPHSTDQILEDLGYDVLHRENAAPNAHLAEAAGSYVIQFGKTYSGWTLRRIVEENPRGPESGLTALNWYANELKPATEKARLDQAAARKYLAVLEAQTQPA